jgi:hypothetical protein
MRMAMMLPNQPHILFLDAMVGSRDDRTEPREGTPARWDSEFMHRYTDIGWSIATQVSGAPEL